MTTWKALATVHDIRPEDTREELTRALTTLHYIATALECQPTEASILEAIGELQSDYSADFERVTEQRDIARAERDALKAEKPRKR
jgi:hypothetical protein